MDILIYITNGDIITLIRISIMLYIDGDNGDGILMFFIIHNTEIFFLL